MTTFRRSVLKQLCVISHHLSHSSKFTLFHVRHPRSLYSLHSPLSTFLSVLPTTSSSESSSTSSSSSRSSLTSSSSVVGGFGQSRAFPWSQISQSRSSSHSTWETTTNLVETLKQLTDEELLDRLDHLERINAKLRRTLKRKRSVFRPADDANIRPYLPVDGSAQNVALLV